jgi:transcriptional regulator with XRE-family HTH domain
MKSQEPLPSIPKGIFEIDLESKIKETFFERRQRNSRYSTTAFARDLGISQPFLSQLMSGKRKLSKAQKLRIADRLGLKNSTATLPASFETIQLNYEHEKILRHWYHFGILELCAYRKNSSDPAWIAQELNISPLEAKDGVERLVEFGYLKITPRGFLRRTTLPFVYVGNGPAAGDALRAYHSSRLQASLHELENANAARVSDRHFETMFVATSKTKLDQARRMMAEFSQGLMKFLVSDSQEEVYQFSVQFFPTQKKRKKI